MDADVVVGPEVRARGVYLRVPLFELGYRDAVLLGDRLALITRFNYLEIVTVVDDSRHSGGVAGVRGRGGTAGDRSYDGGGRVCHCFGRGCRGDRGSGLTLSGCRGNRGSGLIPAVIRVLANNAVSLSSLEVGAGHARVDIGELLD